jgi:pimeloyl-ACP methyl ester carboxylesterase
MSNRPLVRRSVAAGAAAALMAGLVVAATTAGTPAGAVPPPRDVLQASLTSEGAPAAAAARVPGLSWTACDAGFQCATARVPLDYRHPDGATISIAVTRHLATDRKHLAGTLFINIGGPNEEIEFIAARFPAIPAALRGRFDIIFFDPRGFGFSSAVRCFPDAVAEDKFLGGLPPFPVGERQDAVWEKTWARFDALCASNGGSLLLHDTTADVARDMNQIRQAVGTPELNYLGLSYGTGLGATYANLFPATVGHMALDGNLDPVAWTSGGSLPEPLREGEDLAGAATLRSFLDLCGQASTAACAFSAGSPAATEAKFAALLDRLLKHPVTIGTPPQTFTYATVAAPELDVVSQWQSIAVLLQQLWAAPAADRSPAANQTAGRLAAGQGAAAPGAVYTGLDQQIAVLCADTADPRGPRAYQAAARLAYARSGGFGLQSAWLQEPCAAWPAGAGQDRYTGPWNRPTAGPVLVIGNTGDPKTPYQGAVAMSRDLGRARLLTVDGFGHTELQNPSTCATSYEVSYLTTGALPPAGTVCAQDGTPFPAPAG